MTLKRVFDVLGAASALVVATPVLAAASAAVWLSSPGPVLYRARRVGKDGVPFTLLKFRTMRSGAEGPGVTSADDPRITPAGRVLRRLKIDELPQLVNVLRGEMSLVGPRPEDPMYVAGYSNAQRRILSVRPGMTSPASIAYRDEERLMAARGDGAIDYYREEILPAKLQIDLEYIARRSLWLDIGILFQTISCLVRAPRRRD